MIEELNTPEASISIRGRTMIVARQAETWIGNPRVAKATMPNEQTATGDVANWGENNNLPAEMMADIENTGVLSSGIESKTRFAIGKGPMLAKVVSVDKDGQEELEFVSNTEISEWMEMSNFFEDSYSLTSDLLSLGNGFDQLVLNRDRNYIAGFKRHDPVECRFSRMDEKTRKSEYVYLSSDWSSYSNSSVATKDMHMGKVALLDRNFPLQDLQSRTSGYNFMLAIQYPLKGRKFYAVPLWHPARQWVKMSQAIPGIKKAMTKNALEVSKIVEIHPLFWEIFDATYKRSDAAKQKAIQEKFYDQIEKGLIGGENQYKSIFSTKIRNPVTNEYESAITITTIDDKIKEGKMLVDSQAANSEILFALQMNPALIGADAPGGPYSGGSGSGSTTREAYLVQVLMQEMERRLIGKRFMIAKHFNGWDKNLVLRFPNQLLTTLNTGTKTQSVS